MLFLREVLITKKLQSMSFQSLPPKDVSIKSSGMKDSETSIRHEFVTLSLRREGVIDCCDLSLFQLSLLGKEGGDDLLYARCHPFYRFFLEVVPYIELL